MKPRQYTLGFFIIVAIVHIIGILIGSDYVQIFTKPLIVPSLFVYYFSNTTVRSKPLAIALVFCWLGDVALMLVRHNEIFFMLGLGMFLIGHIFFILTYRQCRWEAGNNDMTLGTMIRFSALLMMPGIVLVIMLYPNLGGLKVPVMCYALAITAMVKFAFYRFQRTTPMSFWMVFCGSLIFMLSDSLIAINKFMSPLSYAGILVMTTYIAAQFMIVSGLIKHLESRFAG